MTLCFSLADQSFQRTKSIGILNVSLGLLKALANTRTVERLAVLSNNTLSLQQCDFARGEITNFNQAGNSKLGRLLWDQWGVYRAAKRFKCDWLFLPKGYASFVARPPMPLAAYVHDAMQDFYQTHYPTAVSRWEKEYFDRSMVATLRYASVIFTNSAFSRQEVLRLAEKLKISPCPVITAGIGFNLRLPSLAPKNSNYIVVLISKWPHKLTVQAVNFLQRWQQSTGYAGDIHLVGQLPDGLIPPVAWKHFQRLSENEYSPMLRQSRALIYFSAYEGFGMPPVEAMLAGTPAVYSRIPAMEESACGCGYSFANNSEEEFHTALNSALACPEQKLTQWTAVLKSAHSWDVVADRIIRGFTCSDN